MNATLVTKNGVTEISISSSDLHRGRIMATSKTINGFEVYRFTKRKNGDYVLKGQTDGLLVWNELSKVGA